MTNEKKKLGYLQKVDKWLDDLLQTLEPGVEVGDAKREIKEKILESYRNGLRDGAKGIKPKSYQKTGK